MLKRIAKNEKGFTLIELLAVIVILGIIAAIAIPSVTGLIHKTEAKAKVAEAIQIIDAAKLYVASEGVPSDGNLNNNDLGTYLSNVKDTGYAVSVTEDSNGKATYKISNHDSVSQVTDTDGDASSASESELLAYTSNNN